MMDAFGVGAIVGLVVVIATVIVSWYISIERMHWYVPISWVLIGLSVGTMALLAMNGLEKAFGFLITYVALTWIPLLIGFHLGVETVSILGVTSIIALIEFLLIFAAKSLGIA